MRKTVAALGLATMGVLTPAVAHAQSAAAAEELFQKGHMLFEEKKYAEACPKFAESFRLDPLTGALLALASCHEAEGKLASAWAEYVAVAGRAKGEGNKDRAEAAQQRANTLQPKLAKITIALGQGAETIENLQVKRDGTLVGAESYNLALPVDRGEHVIEATAPGRQPFTKRVTMADGASELVAIPALAEAASSEPPPAATPEQPGSSPFPLRTVGIIAAGAGIVAVGIGSVFGLQAISKNSDSNTTGCTGDVCTGAGKTNRQDAVSAGNTSTLLFVVGGLLVGGGVVMYVVGGPPSADGAQPPKAAIAASPAVGPGSAGFALSGRF